ncbi:MULTISPECIES: ABC transporter permease [unclassified Avibacterium]|uniref:ABC transporter permease n=1 Tax=unclassified Avibacterium TaxID=2685287 RepID=UPI00218A4505|nr:ABC transporter permease [Avibacterium sp. 21-599]MCW9717783.1 ABC transporter permease [Avibacterium sp. 21-599]URL02550.1 ABC transporter permease [Avibacterium sp. 20-126]
MQYGEQTSLRESFQIQWRVLKALLLREIITRYGRKNLGFLWLFVEPFMMTLVIVLMWHFFRADRFSTLNIVAFAITGYPLLMMWRNASNRAIGAIDANMALLYHRNVRPLDTLFSRMTLEIMGATVAQILMLAFLVMIGWIEMPNDVLYMLFAWFLMALFAIGLGLIICSLAYYLEFFGKIWGTLTFLMFPISGAFFLVSSLPSNAQSMLLWFPMIHGTEMFRHGYFGSSIVTMESPSYLLACDLVMLLIGLLMVRSFSNRINAR